MIERVYSISLYISTQWCQRQIKFANFVSIFTTHIFSFTSKYIYVQQTLHMKLHIMCAFIPCHNSFEIKSSTTSSAAKTVTYKTLHFFATWHCLPAAIQWIQQRGKNSHFICLECFWLCLINKCQNKIRHNRFRYSAIDRFYASKCAIIRWWILTKATANAGNRDSSQTLC